MTFPLQKPGGFVDVHSEVTPLIMTNIDLWLSRAVDGNAGGLWIGANAWQGNQTFRSTCTAQFEGPIVRSGAAAVERIRYGTIPDVDNQTIGTTSDHYRIASPAAARDHELVVAGTAGRRISVACANAGAFPIIIHRTLLGGAIVTLGAAGYSEATFVDNGAAWELKSMSGGATAGADA